MTMHKATTDHPGVGTALEIKDLEEGSEPLVWTRHEQKGLFELFCTQTGEFFARYSDGDMKTTRGSAAPSDRDRAQIALAVAPPGGGGALE